MLSIGRLNRDVIFPLREMLFPWCDYVEIAEDAMTGTFDISIDITEVPIIVKLRDDSVYIELGSNIVTIDRDKLAFIVYT